MVQTCQSLPAQRGALEQRLPSRVVFCVVEMGIELPPQSVIGWGPLQEQHDLGSKAEAKPEGANSWRLSTKHTLYSWATCSFSTDVLSSAPSCPSQQVNAESGFKSRLSGAKVCPSPFPLDHIASPNSKNSSSQEVKNIFTAWARVIRCCVGPKLGGGQVPFLSSAVCFNCQMESHQRKWERNI